jgi:hypothetical protein
MNGLTGHMTKRVFYDGGGADTPAYDDRYVTLKPGKKAQVNATYQPALPYPGGRKKGGTAPRTSPKARTRSDATPPPKNARGIPQN